MQSTLYFIRNPHHSFEASAGALAIVPQRRSTTLRTVDDAPTRSVSPDNRTSRDLSQSPTELTVMSRRTLLVSSPIATTALAIGCASTPTESTAPTQSAVRDCHQLSAEIAVAEAEKHAALEKEKGAWKAVVPFVVVARYADGKLAANKSDKQLDKLRAEFTRQGCAHDAN
jgi:hypothetical protein